MEYGLIDMNRAIDKGFAYLGLNILPHLLAPHASRARQRLFQGFHSYYASNGHETGSRVIQARYEVNRKHGISLSDIGHFDLSVCYGLLINTIPATSWVLYYMYSSPSVLKEVRETISSYIRTTHDVSSNGILVRHVNIAEVVAGYPFLGAFVQETLRVQSTNASGRVVLRDTLIEDRYLLKKDSFLLIPSADLHSNAAVWGPSVASFDPQRFLQKKTKVPASAYRAYGSGASVCPGRHFAANEILIILIVMVCKYDLRPRGGEWKVPESTPHITTSILTPVGGLEVKLVERENGGSGVWKFSWNEEDSVKGDH
jgi:cytochrome P450